MTAEPTCLWLRQRPQPATRLSPSFPAALYRCISLQDGTQPLTFWAAVRSSARAAAKFLAHWLSCMAEAWSVMVGTVALAAATIFPPGCRARTKSSEKRTNMQHLSCLCAEDLPVS